MNKIYGLVDPQGVIRYVGRTKQRLYIRLNQHICGSRRSKFQHPRAIWIRSLLSQGKRPKITHLETVEDNQAVLTEARWMAKLEGLKNSGSAAQGGTRSYIVDWTPELDARLGKEADSKIAEIIGVCRETVSYRRKVLGISASFDRSRNTRPPDNSEKQRIILPEWVINLLGSMPDYRLAQKAKVSKRTILRARHKRSIPSFAKMTGNSGQFQKGCFPIRWLNERNQIRG